MKIIVDANIVFSAILNTKSKIGDILINSRKDISFIAPDFLRTEIFKHKKKLIKLSGYTESELSEIEYIIYKSIQFISEEQIKESAWKASFELCSDIDPNDIPYIAYAKHFRCKTWSGDKKLITGLKKKGFANLITTDELFELINLKSK